MSKFLLRFFFIIVITLISLVIFLSYFGLETERFNDLIKNKTNEVNQYVKLDFRNTKIHLNPTEFNLVIKLQNPKILIRNNKINLLKIDLFLALKSFITSDFLLQRSEVAFAKNDIKDLTKITNIFLPKIINKKLNKIFYKGSLEGEFIIPFKSDGSIGENYGFSGRIVDATINLRKDIIIKNLTTEINNLKDQGYEIIIKKGSVFDLEISESKINLKHENKETKIQSILKTKGKFTFEKIKKISNLLNLKVAVLKDINGIADLNTTINFDIDKNFRIKNVVYSSNGAADNLILETQELKIIKKYLPLHSSKMRLFEIKYDFRPVRSGSTQKLSLSGGFCYLENEEGCHSFNLEHFYHSKNKKHQIKGEVSLSDDEVLIPRLNYKKEKGAQASMSFDIDFIIDKYYRILELAYQDLILSSSNPPAYGLELQNVKLNNQFELISLNNVYVKTYSDPKGLFLNNDFSIKMTDKLTINGNLFDARPLFKSLYKKNERKTFSKEFKGDLKINFKEAITDTKDDPIKKFSMIASIDKGSYVKLSSLGYFTDNEIIEMSLYQTDKDKKTLQVNSDRARPFIKNFDFIKGFEGGKLEYKSITSKEGSNSSLLVTDFKVSKVPALAQLLTLASLQGIADTLSGEGIRFESFEMKSNSKGNVMNIEDALAIGPAVSILLEGYVDKGKTVSLRGTLVPATKLNAIIASIPVVGDILVGKKTGEGVVGVSFKMKGSPKDIKTTVNPIKTLTPRFIVRAVEKMKKMKKKKKEETK